MTILSVIWKISDSNKSRVAEAGRIDLGKKKVDVSVESEPPFYKNSDPPVATHDLYGKGSKYSQGGSKYGVSSHKDKVIEDNWVWGYWGNMNSEDLIKWYYWNKTNKNLQDIKDQKNILKYEGGKYCNNCSQYYNSSIWYNWVSNKSTKGKFWVFLLDII